MRNGNYRRKGFLGNLDGQYKERKKRRKRVKIGWGSGKGCREGKKEWKRKD